MFRKGGRFMGDLTLGQIDRKPLLNDVDADKEF